MSILTLILFIFILSLIVLVHELGHFFWAKKFGVHIYEFSIGMGPAIYTKTGKDNINYSFRAIPIGGFVAMAGEVYEDGDEELPKDKYLCNKLWWQRIIVMAAGVVNNFILAIILIFISTFCFKTEEVTLKLDSVIEGSAVEKAGIVAGDKIIAVNGKDVSYANEFQIRLLFAQDKKSQEFTILHKDGTTDDYKIVPKEVKDENGNKVSYGFGFYLEEIDTFKEKIVYSFRTFINTFDTMNLTIYGLFTGKVGLGDLSGPVGIYEFVGDSVSSDVSFSKNVANVIYLIWLLSINVGYINILPFPAFDGGRILFILIEKLKGSPVNQKFENVCHAVGFILILLLIVVVTISDILKLL